MVLALRRVAMAAAAGDFDAARRRPMPNTRTQVAAAATAAEARAEPWSLFNPEVRDGAFRGARASSQSWLNKSKHELLQINDESDGRVAWAQ